MKLLYVADGRSPIAQNWIDYFIRSGHKVHLASSYPCEPMGGLSSMVEIRGALSGLYEDSDPVGIARKTMLRRLLPVKLRTLIKQQVTPINLPHTARYLEEVIEKIQPDLIHAMRVPYEGMMTAIAMEGIASKTGKLKKIAWLISVWGNDFTLHARSTKRIYSYTRQTLQSADGLHTDCQRDQRIAAELGFDSKKPRIVLPGGGGVELELFYPPETGKGEEKLQSYDRNQPITIINPRRFRAYVRNDTFFQAIPRVINKFPNVHFLCPGMRGEAQADKWIAELGIGKHVELLAPQTRPKMAELFRQSQITVSITTHDGTPNTLLEAMACGCFPIAGDIESLREWITPEVNGLLIDPADPEELAEAIMKAIAQPTLRIEAGKRNIELVRERAEYGRCMQAAEKFYERLIFVN